MLLNRYAIAVKQRTTLRAYHQGIDFNLARFLASAKSDTAIPDFGKPVLPEVKPLTGRANCGKSSLLNAVLGRKYLLSKSKHAGSTRSLDFYQVGEGKASAIFVDAPGYGRSARSQWGDLFTQYITTRPQLKRIYILINGVHGVKESDVQMLEYLSTKLVDARGIQPFTVQAVVTKVDLIPSKHMAASLEDMRTSIFANAPLCLPPIFTSVTMNPPFGVDTVRSNISDVCGFPLAAQDY
ncbi:unnamed protein product [Mycena citricolor]|uniref:EngB-type G domain-containing protein n=1 Tax=Mycena citricolor TaxID=2018698 RepID=A0AAD2K1I7_9AGAR|nr:unnamed protein product [Mycena citricolor]